MQIRIAGVGSYVPPITVTNERLVKAIPGWPAEKIEEKTGIRERRHAWPIDEVSGRAVAPEPLEYPGPSVQLAERALRDALSRSGLEPRDLDGLFVTGCTPDHDNFSHDAMLIHRRLGMRPEAFAVHHSDGCGGAMHCLALARELLMGRQRRTLAVVGVNAFSPHLDREVYSGKLRKNGKDLGSFLSIYLFGDGAGAMIVRGEPEGEGGFLGSYAGNEHVDLVVRPGGGNMFPAHPGRSSPSDFAFYVDGQLVASSFGPYLRRAIDGALERAGLSLGDVSRFYLHQANKRVLEAFVRENGIAPEKVPMHMERYGNMVTAGTLVLLAEELAEGRVALGSGETILMAALGAGAQWAAHVIKL